MQNPERLHIFSRPHPFEDTRIDRVVIAGGSLKDSLAMAGFNFPANLKPHVFVDDLLINPANWDITYPKADQVITVCVVPEGGGGGGDSNKVLRTIALIAVVAISIAVPYAIPALHTAAGLTWGGLAVSTAISIGGSLLVNALIPPSYPKYGSDETGTRRFELTARANYANRYAVVPRIFGTHRFYPPYAAAPITRRAGDDQYLEVLFCVGEGTYELTSADCKIGTTDLDDYSNVNIIIGDKDATKALYKYDWYIEPNLPVELLNANPYTIRTTPANTTHIQIDLTWPTGLWIQYDSGKIRAYRDTFSVQYSIKNANSWNNFPSTPTTITRKEFSSFSVGYSVGPLASNEYDVRIKKTSADVAWPRSGVDGGTNIVTWSIMRSINTNSLPVTQDNLTLIAMRIKASEQLTGHLSQFSCLARSQLAHFNATTAAFTATLTTTRNPAWAYAEVLRGASNNRPATDAEIDGPGLLTWANFCDANNYHLDVVLDNSITIFELLHDIASVGRASPTVVNGKYSVIIDSTQSVPVQHISPRNSWNFSGRKVFPDIPHALRCQFKTEDFDYQDEELLVYNDGYNPGNATLFETMRFWGITDPDHVWKHARYFMAAAKLRPEVFDINMDFEHLVCGRGDLVRFTHDVIEVGYGQARIKAVAKDGGLNCTGVTMDDPITMAAGSYGAQIRRVDGTMVSGSIVTDAGEQYTISFSPVISAASCPATGDMIFFGEAGLESLDCLVQKIEPGPDLSARLSLIEYAPTVFDALTGTIPAYTPSMTKVLEQDQSPPLPVLESITVGRWPLVTTEDRESELHAFLNFSISVDQDVAPAYFQAQIREFDDSEPATTYYTAWAFLPSIAEDQHTVRIPVENNRTYDFRVRSVSQYGLNSAWAATYSYGIAISTNPPEDITGLALIGGGSTFKGGDIEIEWSPSTDTWRVRKYRIETYATSSPATVVRTAFKDVSDAFYSYTTQMNVEDNGGLPATGITFKVYAVDYNEGLSGTSADLSVTGLAPDAPSGLALLQGGSTFSGQDVELAWTPETDPYWVAKYKIETYATASPATVLRTEYRDVADAFYSYAYAMNVEDNNGTPNTALTFKVFSQSILNLTSSSSADIAVTAAAPSPPSGLSLIQGGATFSGSTIELFWTAQTDPYWVGKYKIETYATASPATVLRAEYRDVADAFYSYTLANNLEDNGGLPATALTFKVFSISTLNVTSVTSSDLAVSALTPTAPTGLALIQGGSVFAGPDVELSWDVETDPYWIAKYKIETYATASPATVKRTEYRDVSDAFYSYTWAMNAEDSGGAPITGLTFKVYSISTLNLTSPSADLAVSNAVPINVAGLSASGRMGGVEFNWNANTALDFSYFTYRLQVETDGWSAWSNTFSNRVGRMLTDTEKTTHGYDANIAIEVNAIDIFDQQSTAAATANADALGLAVEVSDIEDYQLTPSKFDIPLPLIDGLTITNNSPSAGYVAWSAFNLYLNGTLYSISSGDSNNEFICFKNLLTTLVEIDTHPSENYADWDPAEDFLIIWNNGGTGKEAWSTFMNLVASSGFIGSLAVDTANIANLAVDTGKINDLAVTNAKINDLDAAKITTGFLDAARINAGTIVVSKLNSDATNRMFDSATRDYADVGGTKPPSNADNTAVNETFGQESDINALLTTNGPAEANADVTSANETFGQESDINALLTTNGPAEANADVTSDNYLSAGSIFSETFEDPNNDITTRWPTYEGSGESSIVASTEATAGGNYWQLGANDGTDRYWAIYYKSIPFDPNKLYRVRVRIRKTQGVSSPYFYLGFSGRNYDDTAWVSSAGTNDYTGQHNFVAYQQDDSAWTIYTGYLKGTASTGTGTTEHPVPTDPAVMHEDTRYFRPHILVNFGQTGISQIDYFIVDEITGEDAFTEDTVTTIKRPGGGTFTGAASETGVIKVTMPRAWGSYMLRFALDVYLRDEGTSFTLLLGGHAQGPSLWYHTSVQLLGSTAADQRVRFGRDLAPTYTNKNCICIGETTSVWEYAKIVVRDVVVGNANYDIETWEKNWDITITSSLTDISLTSKDWSNSLVDAQAIINQGNLATQDTAGAADLDTTVISGGKIVTGLLTASNILTGTLSADRIAATSLTLAKLSGASGTLTISGTGTVEVNVAGGIVVKEGADITMESSASNLSILRYEVGATYGGAIRFEQAADATRYSQIIAYNTKAFWGPSANTESDANYTISLGTSPSNDYVRVIELVSEYHVKLRISGSTKVTITTDYALIAQDFRFEGGNVFIQESASAKTDVTGYGQLWVKNTTPCQLWFTRDDGTEVQLS